MRRNQCVRFLSVLSITVFVLSGCGAQNTTDTAQEVKGTVVKETAGKEVQTTTVSVMDIYKTTLFDAQIDPAVTELSFPESGTFLEYEVNLGSSVKEGDVLAKTDDGDLNEQIEDAQEALEELNEDYENNVEYYQKKIKLLQMELQEGSLDEVGKVNQKLEIEKQQLLFSQEEERYELLKKNQEATLEELKSKVGSNIIIAPHDGVVVYRSVLYEGDVVTDSRVVIGLTDETEYYMVCDNISSITVERAKRIYGVKDGKEYDLTYEEMDSGKASKLSINGIEKHSSFLIDNPDESITYSGYAKVVIVNAQALQVLAVPSITINSDTVGKYVYVQENNEKVKTYIHVGITDGINTEVTDGLKEGDVIYVEN